ncbi:hypothetical protein [Haloarcula laminariae]|uniref:hypothetical protein n=1 Tax=Haloarcula laminariae TaxID=2961577 RepID=UPI0021CAB31A|nr:hypothetical protein [Halomicroarcula laminariae]
MGTYDIRKFYMDYFDDGELEDDSLLNAQTDKRVEIPGTWRGNVNIMSEQACARYSFDLLENGSQIASSDEEILIYGYQYELQQSAEAAYITYHPSVQPEWDRTLRLSYPNSEETVTPTIRPDDGVFEFNFSDSDIEPGRYEWILEITPPNSYTIEIGTFNETLISVDPNDESGFPSSEEAIQTAGVIANTSATQVTDPQQLSGNGLSIESSGHGGGTSGSTAGRFLTRDVSVQATPAQAFGSETNRQFRINNHTRGSSLTFDPA